jgi:hypothetical protein
MHQLKLLAFVTVLAFATETQAESVEVKYGGRIDLERFSCQNVERSSFVNRICYDARNAHMLIQLKQAWYQYCGIDGGTIQAMASAGSVGRFFNQNVKGRFPCQ